MTGLKWRPDRNVTGPRSHIFDNWLVRLSTTQKTADTLSMTFSENVGSDELVVLDRAVTLSTSNVGPPEGPKNFDYILEFDTPFFYDPNEGNLLIDMLESGRTESFAPDLHSSLDIAFVGNFSDPNAAVASFSDTGIGVVEFVFVPEPSTLFLSLLGLSAIVIGHRRNSKT